VYITEDGGVLVRCVGRVLFPAPDVDKEPLEPVPVEAVTQLRASEHFQFAFNEGLFLFMKSIDK
jgi:hypothetical protein